jgi:NAD(P)H dehydrogenase (quinone)
MMIAITGATGQLGRLVIDALLARNTPANHVVALVRDPHKAQDLAAKGVTVRHADYSKPDTLLPGLSGVDRLLLISSNELGQRAAQHRAVVDAAKTAGVKLLAYTSVLHADKSILDLATEHLQTEDALRVSGVPFTLLRNGWYTENYAASIPAALEHGAILGSAQNGKISSAARADYALAAAVVLTSDDTEDHAGRVYELAGDGSYTLTEFAQAVAAQFGKAVVYKDLPQDDYKAALTGFGFPDAVADLLADSDAGAAKGALFDDSGALRQLIGRPTIPFTETIRALSSGAAAA